MNKIMPRAVLSATLIAATALPALARFENVRPEVERHLSDIGVSETDVKKISIFPRRRTGNATSIITGYNATISFHNCGGHLAINMNSVGDVKDVYNRSGCNIPGVPSY